MWLTRSLAFCRTCRSRGSAATRRFLSRRRSKIQTPTKERIMRGYSFMRCIGRLKPGVTMQQAQAAMPALEQSYREQHGEAADSTWTSVLLGANEDATGDLRPAFVSLLIARWRGFADCMQQRCEPFTCSLHRRTPRIAMRMASVAIAAVSCGSLCLKARPSASLPALSDCFSRFGLSKSFRKSRATTSHWKAGFTLHLPVLLFTLGLSLVTGLIMGVYPAWQSSAAIWLKV